MSPELVTWTETLSYRCCDCGHKGHGTVEIEERTDAMWSDQSCDMCGSDDLEWSER